MPERMHVPNSEQQGGNGPKRDPFSVRGGYSPNYEAIQQEKIRIGLIDVEALRDARARDIAEDRLSADKEEASSSFKDLLKPNGWKKIGRKVWKYNLAREYYRQKEILRAKREIDAEGSAFIDREGKNAEEKRELHQKVVGAIVKRFVGEDALKEELLHREGANGETKELLQDVFLGKELRVLVLKHASQQDFDEVQFNKEREQLLEKYNPQYDAMAYADNLAEVVRQVRQAIDHGVSVESLEKDIEIVTGKARAGARTEAQLTATDKVINWIRSTRVGALVSNEAVLALGVATVYSIGSAVTQKAMMSKLGAALSFGATALAGSALAGKRESVNMKMDRAQAARDLAQGKEVDPNNSKRRDEIKDSLYEEKKMAVLTAKIRGIYESDAEGNFTLRADLDQIMIDDSLKALAEAEERVRLSDRHDIDLLSATDPELMEQERTDLDEARARAKVDIRHWMKDNPVAEQGAGHKKQTLEDVLGRLGQGFRQALEADIRNKDTTFISMKRRRVLATALTAFAIGGTIGMVAQEVTAGFDSNRQGIVEGLVGRSSSGAGMQTPLEGLRDFLAGGDHSSFTNETHDVIVRGYKYILPSDVTFVPSDDSTTTYNLTRGGETLVTGLTFEKDGSLTLESARLLNDAGGRMTEYSVGGEDLTSMNVVNRSVSAEEFFAKHTRAVTVKEGLYYDNDTPLHRAGGKWLGADKNELGLHFAESGADKTADGVIEYSISGMTQKDSFHGGEVSKVNPYDSLKATLFHKDHPDQRFFFDVEEDGKINVDLNAQPELRPFFNEDGYPKKGYRLQVNEIFSSGKAGDPDTVRSLATVVGRGDTVDNVTLAVKRSEIVAENSEEFMKVVFPKNGIQTEIPISVPLSGRTPLEKMKSTKSEAIDEGGAGNPEDPTSGDVSSPDDSVKGTQEDDQTKQQETPQPDVDDVDGAGRTDGAGTEEESRGTSGDQDQQQETPQPDANEGGAGGAGTEEEPRGTSGNQDQQDQQQETPQPDEEGVGFSEMEKGLIKNILRMKKPYETAREYVMPSLIFLAGSFPTYLGKNLQSSILDPDKKAMLLDSQRWEKVSLEIDKWIFANHPDRRANKEWVNNAEKERYTVTLKASQNAKKFFREQARHASDQQQNQDQTNQQETPQPDVNDVDGAGAGTEEEPRGTSGDQTKQQETSQPDVDDVGRTDGAGTEEGEDLEGQSVEEEEPSRGQWSNPINLTESYKQYTQKGSEWDGRRRRVMKMADAVHKTNISFLAQKAGTRIENFTSRNGLARTRMDVADMETNARTAKLFTAIVVLKRVFHERFSRLEIPERRINEVLLPNEGETVNAFVMRLSVQFLIAKDSYDQHFKGTES